MGEYDDREHFIPIRKSDLIGLLCREPDLSPAERDEFQRLCRLTEATFHFEYHQTLERLKDAYAAFDPDAETRELTPVSPEEKEKRLDSLFADFNYLLAKANFHRLTREEINQALEGASAWGLDLEVDFSLFNRLEVYARGDIIQRRPRPKSIWNRLRKTKEVEVPVFQRLVVILRLADKKGLGDKVDTNSVYIKVFKDIPKQDLEMLLPGTRVKMSLLDRGKIGLPLLTGLGLTGYKLAGLGGAFLMTSNPFVLLGLAGGTVGYGVRSFHGYLQTKQRYQLTLTQSLYFLNLDNNAGVLFRILDEAEEQECREAILGYYFLWRHAGPEGWTAAELDDRVEEYLEKAAHVKVDFEIGDALDKLKRLKMVEQLPSGRLRAVPIRAALEALDYAWDNYFKYNQDLDET
jgi:hypothetical protein